MPQNSMLNMAYVLQVIPEAEQRANVLLELLSSLYSQITSIHIMKQH